MSQSQSQSDGASEAQIKNEQGLSMDANVSSQDDHCAGLRRSFRSFASALIVAARAADKLTSVVSTTEEKSIRESQIQLNSAVDITLKQRQVIRQKASLLEGILRGNAKESEALQCILKSRPCVGKNKRTFSLMND